MSQKEKEEREKEIRGEKETDGQMRGK